MSRRFGGGLDDAATTSLLDEDVEDDVDKGVKGLVMNFF